MIDGYTVSDVVMYWTDTPVNGVEDAKLHQFTIVGYETTDRKESLATGICVVDECFPFGFNIFFLFVCPLRNLSTFIIIIFIET